MKYQTQTRTQKTPRTMLQRFNEWICQGLSDALFDSDDMSCGIVPLMDKSIEKNVPSHGTSATTYAGSYPRVERRRTNSHPARMTQPARRAEDLQI